MSHDEDAQAATTESGIAGGQRATSNDKPVGPAVSFRPAARPLARELRGHYVLLRPIDPARDAASLFGPTHAPTGDPSAWTYLFDEPSDDQTALEASLRKHSVSTDPVFFAICPLSNLGSAERRAVPRALGEAALMSIVPEHGTIEIGHVLFSPPLQHTRAATEAIYLLAREAIDELGYRRLEWKCDSLNAPSRRAALRYGFRFEGVFAQHRVYKGRSRDTAWFAITDERWPGVRAAFERWLAPENFDAEGRQRERLDASGA